MKPPTSTKKSLFKTLLAWLSLYVSARTLATVVDDKTKDRPMVAIQGITTGLELGMAVLATKGLINALRGRHDH